MKNNNYKKIVKYILILIIVTLLLGTPISLGLALLNPSQTINFGGYGCGLIFGFAIAHSFCKEK